MGHIFLSYRRDDSAAMTARIYEWLSHRYGRRAIVRDVNSFAPGDQLRDRIRTEIGGSSVLLAVIGRQWLTIGEGTGKRRLDSPDDPVRLEIESALAHKIPVIPVLVDNASLPNTQELPAAIRRLSELIALPVGYDPHFDVDMRRLAEALPHTVSRGILSRRRLITGAVAATAASLLVGACIEAEMRLRSSNVNGRKESVHVASYLIASTVYSLAWSPDGSKVVSAPGQGPMSVEVWSPEGNAGAELTLLGASDVQHAVAWSPTAARVASGGSDKLIHVWDSTNGQALFALAGHQGKVYGVAWSPDGSQIVSASEDGTARIWNGLRPSTALIVFKHHAYGVDTVAWSPQSTAVASGSYDNTAQVWDPESGRIIVVYRGHLSDVYSLAWAPNGTRIATASSDRTVQVWDAVHGGTYMTYREHTDSVNGVCWSPDGTRIASASSDKTVQIWEARTGVQRYVYRGHKAGVMAVAWAPNGTLIASGSTDGSIQVWKGP